MSFVYHAFISGLQIRSMTQLDPSIWNPRSHSLTPWRHTIHLWSDGFTVEDGPLQGYEIPSDARLGAELQLDRRRRRALPPVQAAAAAAVEMRTARLERGRASRHLPPATWG